MGVIAYNEEDVKLLARLMRAEAEGEGQQGMLMVGNVGVNRVRGNCLDFRKIRNLRQMVYQNPVVLRQHKRVFLSKSREQDIALARRTIQGQRFWPANFALWFFRPEGPCPPTWYNQQNSGRFKSTASSNHLAKTALAYIKR